MPPPRMAFDSHAPDRPPRPQSDRPAIIKDHALKDFDRLEPGDGSWAAAVDSDVDYSAKLVFSDEEESTSTGGKTENKYVCFRRVYNFGKSLKSSWKFCKSSRKTF